MSLHPLRLRRTLATLTTLHRNLSVPNPTVPAITATISNSTLTPPSSSFGIFQSRWFRSSGGPLSSPRPYKLYKEGDEITEDTVLFEGCDYNHWLIIVDFPKDNKPPPEEMVRTYENICAQGLGISVEEAKKRIYACSTTTFEGFQVLMSEQESKKFEDLPGVVFVLPDSYIDPVNKEYGGDKYENGVITPRPPPFQHGRNQGGRFRQHRNPDQPRYDQPRNPDQPRYDRQRNPMPNQQGNPPYNQQGFAQGDGRNYRPPQNYPPQQSYNQQPPMNNRDYSPRGSDPSYQGSYNQGGQVNFNSQERRDSFQGEQRNYVPPDQRGFRDNNSPERRDFSQGEQRNYMPPEQRGFRDNNFPERRDFSQGEERNYISPEQRDFRGDNRSYVPSQVGNYGQEPSSGNGRNFGQGANPGNGQNFGQGANPGYGQSYGQGPYPGTGQNYGPGATVGSGQSYAQRENPGYGQTYQGQGAGQGFSQTEERNVQGEPTGSIGQGGMQQGRY